MLGSGESEKNRGETLPSRLAKSNDASMNNNMSSHANRPMSTAMSRQLIGTRGQLTSSMGTTAAQGVALGTTVNVSERPVTQQGMRGMSTAAGPRRQVQDSNYYVGLLHQKVGELTAEVGKLDREVRERERAMNEFGGLRKRRETLLAEVRGLEGTLADYNLAMDKARGGTDPSELNEYIAEYEVKNKQLAAEVDRVFVIKKQTDEEARQIEMQISVLHEQAQRKLSVDPQKFEQYQRLLGESQRLKAEQGQITNEIEGVVAKTQELESSLGGGQRSFKEEYEKLVKRLAIVERDERNASEEVDVWETPDAKEAMDKLKNRVEKQSNDLKDADGISRNLQDQLEASKRQLRELNEELESQASGRQQSAGASDQEKYDKLRERDEEMTRFIESFEETKESIASDQLKTRETIVALLEHISQGLEQENNMPSQEQLEEMRDEATFKERHLESSKQTAERLSLEAKQREAELLKIDNLDEKIHIEIASLEQKMSVMRSDMEEFDDLEGLRQRHGATMSSLSKLLKDYQGRKENIKSQVAQLSAKYEEHKAKISASEAHKTLSGLESKLKTYAQTVFHLQEYVETKGRQVDYALLKENCKHLAEQLNAHAKRKEVG